ncbi:unnamed protein product [Gemmataceae bacterium]|nr:unnamed protein product [Gemmataceae bacterium]VTT99006.1 unnamed protein product [Gemmataceae bacterium]
MVAAAAPEPHPPTPHALLAQWDRLVWRYANRIAARHRLDRDDVRQELVAALLGGRYDPRRSAYPRWVELVARTLSGRLSDAGRRTIHTVIVPAVRPRGPGENDGRPYLAELAVDGQLGPDAAAERGDREARVRRAVDALPPAQRAVVAAHFWGGRAVRKDEEGVLEDALASLAVVLAQAHRP